MEHFTYGYLYIRHCIESGCFTLAFREEGRRKRGAEAAGWLQYEYLYFIGTADYGSKAFVVEYAAFELYSLYTVMFSDWNWVFGSYIKIYYSQSKIVSNSVSWHKIDIFYTASRQQAAAVSGQE